MLEATLHQAKEAIKKTVNFYLGKLRDNGSLGNDIVDLACYYKVPMMFYLAAYPTEANRILTFVNETFVQSNGDIKSSQAKKSEKPEYSEYWSYTNGWLVRAANKLKSNAFPQRVYDYLKQFDAKETGGFYTKQPNDHCEIDVLTTAHHALIALEAGQTNRAKAAGEYLYEVLKIQPDITHGFYLRTNGQGKLKTQYPDSQGMFYCVKRQDKDQLYFMIGYPMAFLAMLFQKTKEKPFLTAADGYFNFAMSCHESILQAGTSHKIAWAASILYAATKDEKYLSPIEPIMQHFIEQQSAEGTWYSEDVNTAYDQSAEIACWFMEITGNINQKTHMASMANTESQCVFQPAPGSHEIYHGQPHHPKNT